MTELSTCNSVGENMLQLQFHQAFFKELLGQLVDFLNCWELHAQCKTQSTQGRLNSCHPPPNLVTWVRSNPTSKTLAAGTSQTLMAPTIVKYSKFPIEKLNNFKQCWGIYTSLHCAPGHPLVDISQQMFSKSSTCQHLRAQLLTLNHKLRALLSSWNTHGFTLTIMLQLKFSINQIFPPNSYFSFLASFQQTILALWAAYECNWWHFQQLMKWKNKIAHQINGCLLLGEISFGLELFSCKSWRM